MLLLDGSKRMKYVINYIIAISMAQMVKMTTISSWRHGILRKVTTSTAVSAVSFENQGL